MSQSRCLNALYNRPLSHQRATVDRAILRAASIHLHPPTRQLIQLQLPGIGSERRSYRCHPRDARFAPSIALSMDRIEHANSHTQSSRSSESSRRSTGIQTDGGIGEEDREDHRVASRCCAGFWWGTLTEWRSPGTQRQPAEQQTCRARSQRAVIAASAPAGYPARLLRDVCIPVKVRVCPLLLTVSFVRPSVRPWRVRLSIRRSVGAFPGCLSLSRGARSGGIGRRRGGRSSKRPTQFQPGSQLLLVLRRSAENGAWPEW